MWRVVAHDRSWQVDLLPVVGGSIDADLAGRDFTINAMAEPLTGGPYVDPFGGMADLRDRRLRMVSPRAFVEDPLRTLRLVRLACELGFSVERETSAAAAASAAALDGVAPERVFAELKRIVIAEAALDGLALLDEVGAMSIVLPEVSRMRGVGQSPYHHLDVYEHTLSVLSEVIELSRDPARWLGEQGEAVQRFLAEPLANELTRGRRCASGRCSTTWRSRSPAA